MSHLNTVGIDLAKRIVQVCIINRRHQKPLVNKAIKTKELLTFMANQPVSIIVSECNIPRHPSERLP